MNDHQCGYCRKRLEIGHDVRGVQHGVVGHKRFIPLDEAVLFCSDECLSRYYNGTPKLPPRIP